MNKPRVFLDVSVLKHSIRPRRRLRPQAHQPWDGNPILWEFFEDDPNARAVGNELRAEITVLPRLAQLAASGEFELLRDVETMLESWGVLLGGDRSLFSEATITHVEGPVKYSRVIIGPSFGDAEALQVNFLEGITRPRFLEWQKICGVHKGSKKYRNQLLDAYHLWTAEAAGATHFLTTDFRMIRKIRGRTTAVSTLKVVRPSELLSEILADMQSDAARSASGPVTNP